MSYVGSSIGSIRIESRPRKGGMGEVYLGYDPRLKPGHPEASFTPKTPERTGSLTAAPGPPLDKFQTVFETMFVIERTATHGTELSAAEGGPTRERLLEVA